MTGDHQRPGTAAESRAAVPSRPARRHV